jgi:glycerol-3-phosphate dehydrogenase (NAD(P)+)
MKNTITILGAGAWGTAVATHLAANEHDVILWCYESEVVDEIQTNHTNTHFLPNISLSHKIKASCSFQEALSASDWVFEAVPVKFLREILNQAKPYVKKTQKWVILSKGIEQETLLLPAGIVSEVLGASTEIAIIGGPNFAKELAEQCYTATMIASKNQNIARELSLLLENNYLKTYIIDDITGVQVGGALKNLFTIAMGIAIGSGCKENTRAYLVTKSLEEMAKISLHLGGRSETIYGLAGFGDLFLSCTGTLSKNLKMGKMLGQGHLLSDISTQLTTLPEGINTLQSIKSLIKKYNLNLPICSGTYDFVYEGKSFKNLLYNLMDYDLEVNTVTSSINKRSCIL